MQLARDAVGTGEPLLELVRREAVAAGAALGALEPAAVDAALERSVQLLAERRDHVLDANANDLAAAKVGLDAGALDRLRLDAARFDAMAHGVAATAALDPIEREVRSWRLPNGLVISERRIPVGVVGANFEARPNVAVDIASQVLKSGNSVLLRTGGAALATVTALVDGVLRPAFEEHGLPGGAVGLVRSPDRAGAEALVSLPGLVPLVILRGSGPSTAALTQLAATNGVGTLAHAEGGGVLYAHAGASAETLASVARASLDRLGVCNRLNLALVDRDSPELAAVVVGVCADLGIEVRSTSGLPGTQPLDRVRGYEWASDEERVATVTVELVAGLDEAVSIANEETSGLAATIVTDDEAVARRFLDDYRGTAACWNATTRFTDGFELLGIPETGVNVDRLPGPRGPVTYRDLFLRQYRIVGDGTQQR